MDYKINVSDKIKLSDSVQISVFKKAKVYYKKRPWVLIFNILLTITTGFIHPVVAIIICLIAIFILPSWKEKQVE